MKINSHNEWDKLREIIVGRAGPRVCLLFSEPGPVPAELRAKVDRLVGEAFPPWLVEEMNEDLEELCDVLKKFGAKVYRPNGSDTGKVFSTPDWSAAGDQVYDARDLHLVVGNTVIESPSQERHRYFESMGLYDIWYEYFKEGFRWIAAPKPKIAGDYLIHYEENGEKYIRLAEDEILFEAANIVRIGRDLLYLVSRSGNYLGAKWLQSVLADEYRVHATAEIYRSSHIDSTVICLRPGLVLLCAERVNPEICPKIFEKWDKIYFNDILPIPEKTLEFQENFRKKIFAQLAELNVQTSLYSLASKWIGMNVLSLDPETVVVDKRQTGLIRVLEQYGFIPVPISFRHSYLMGGIHCSTLDTVRDSKLESYCDLE